ncbi:MAG: MBL fold metallo-hydrolase [Lewinella sp.]
MRNLLLLASLCCLLTCCRDTPPKQIPKRTVSDVSLVVLGNVQDAGAPHIACKKDCCRELFDNPDPKRQVTSLGLIDRISGKTYLFEASPDLPRQTKMLKTIADVDEELPDGIFLTHAHIGHYAGLMYLGKEATNAKQVPVYAMPRMRSFLTNDGPWSQLVSNNNIALQQLTADSTILLTPQLQVTPFQVPHRDEFSETVGYLISGPHQKALFIPDIDKWEKWDRQIEDLIAEVDYAFLDGTFYDAAELNTRDISQIPHPFVSESMRRFAPLSRDEKDKINFLHFNHTNKLLVPGSKEISEVFRQGFRVAYFGDQFGL